MQLPFFSDTLRMTLRIAFSKAPCCVAWDQKRAGWLVYSPTQGCPPGAEPEFFVAHHRHLPIPLTENAMVALASLIRSTVYEGTT